MEYYVDKFNRRLKPKTKIKDKQTTATTIISGGGGGGSGMSLETDGWDAKRRKITNVEVGTSFGDVATIDQTLITTPQGGFKHGTDNYNILKTGVDLDMGIKKIKNLCDGTDKTDAVALGQVMTNNKRWWDARSMQVSKVKSGTTGNDAVNISQFVTSLRLKDVGKKNAPNIVFNAENKAISNVKDGTLPTDAATVKQLPTDYMKIVANKWDARLQPITSVRDGSSSSDVVVMRQALTTIGGHLFERGANIYDLTSLKK